MVKYTKLTQVQHIIKRPGMYIGSTDKISDFVSTSIFDIHELCQFTFLSTGLLYFS